MVRKLGCENPFLRNKFYLCYYFRYPNAFELSTTKSNNRTYLFAASTPEEKMAWMRTLSKVC